ncbi:MAG: SWIM zinc finger family protein [Nannocystaceae bacterium]
MGYRDRFSPYVPVATRRQRAAKKVARLKKAGRTIRPVEIDGRKIATTFWGESWCKNLEAYSDYANRLPRGRTYARNGSVIDLQIEAGRVRAMVSGSSIYSIDIKITPLAKKRWKAIQTQCAGKIDSMVELLQGSISKGVMEMVTRHGEGLFPSTREISLSCSCPDVAVMCKHVAAALYGVGARLDHEPEMLFTLRGVDPAEMIAAAVSDAPRTKKKGRGRILETDDVSSVFGIDLELDADADADAGADVGNASGPTRRRHKKTAAKTSAKTASTRTPTRKKATAKKATAKRATTKKATAKRATAKKATAKKATAKKATAKKATAKKATAKRATAKKATAKRATTTKQATPTKQAASLRSRKIP